MSAQSTDVPQSDTNDAPVTAEPNAAEKALEMMEENDMGDGGLRLYVQQGGCAGLSYGMRFEEEPEPDDTTVTSHGLDLYVDPASMDYIGGSVLIFEGGLHGKGFDVENPNTVSECGCGESFRT